MKKRFTEEQIIKVLNEVKSGLKVAEVCRKYGCTAPHFASAFLRRLDNGY